MSSNTLLISTTKKKEAVDITKELNQFISKAKILSGICTVFTTHTTCCITAGEIGEGTDDDLLDIAQKIIPEISFRHAHDPSHAWSHMIASIIGPSLTLPISGGNLVLGTWQSVLLLELDGPKQRNIVVTAIND